MFLLCIYLFFWTMMIFNINYINYDIKTNQTVFKMFNPHELTNQ